MATLKINRGDREDNFEVEFAQVEIYDVGEKRLLFLFFSFLGSLYFSLPEELLDERCSLVAIPLAPSFLLAFVFFSILFLRGSH